MAKRIVERCRRYSSGRLSQASFEQLQYGVAQTSSGALWGLMAADFSLSQVLSGVRRKLLQGFFNGSKRYTSLFRSALLKDLISFSHERQL